MSKKIIYNKDPLNFEESGKDKTDYFHRLNFDIPLNLFIKMRHALADNGMSMKDFIRDAISEKLLKSDCE